MPARRSLIQILAVFALTFLILAAGVAGVMRVTVDRLLYWDATQVAETWARYVAQNVSDIETIASGELPSEESMRFFERARFVKHVFGFEVYDLAGKLQLASDAGRIALVAGEVANPTAARAASSGEAKVAIKESNLPTRPQVYSEAYVPILVGGEPKAVIAAFIDLTEKHRHFRGVFAMAVFVLCAITGVAFILPTIAWYRRTKEKQSADLKLLNQNRELFEREETLAEQNRRFDAALNNMAQGLCMFDADGRLIVCNKRYAELFKLPPEMTMAGTAISDMIAYRLGARTGPKDLQHYLDTQLNRPFPERPSAYRLELQDGRTVHFMHEPMGAGGWVATVQDISESIRADAQINHMAHHDALTNLANRVLFRKKIEKALARMEHGGNFAVICLDLDNFKAVNDTLGHPVGDVLLRAVTDRILNCVRETDTVARLGGDEFAIIQTELDRPEEAGRLARRLVEDIGRPYDIEGHQVMIGTSVGIAVAPGDGADPDKLIKNADMALYRAKSEGRGTFRYFQPEMDAYLQARRALELDLRGAVVNGEFALVYQMVVDARTEQPVGCEALVRWRHRERGIVMPAEFIPLAEEIGLINVLGEWVLRRACNEAATWPEHLKVAVNLSPAQFRNRSLVNIVMSALASSGLPAQRLELEITESVLLHDSTANIAMLHQLRSLGVRIVMDDFGTGYSSLSYLRSFPFDKIKIDRSFVRELEVDGNCEAIVRAIIDLAKSLKMGTTAEGVETEHQFRRVRELGCAEVQGFLFGRPCTAEAMREKVRPLSSWRQRRSGAA